MFFHGLAQADRSTRDSFPVIGVEVVEHPRADESAKQPTEQRNAHSEFHWPPLALLTTTNPGITAVSHQAELATCPLKKDEL